MLIGSTGILRARNELLGQSACVLEGGMALQAGVGPGVLTGWEGRSEACACLQVVARRSLTCSGRSDVGTGSPSSPLSKAATLRGIIPCCVKLDLLHSCPGNRACCPYGALSSTERYEQTALVGGLANQT